MNLNPLLLVIYVLVIIVLVLWLTGNGGVLP